MRDKIQQIREKALAEIDKADGLEKLNDVRAAILGKKGGIAEFSSLHGLIAMQGRFLSHKRRIQA